MASDKLSDGIRSKSTSFAREVLKISALSLPLTSNIQTTEMNNGLNASLRLSGLFPWPYAPNFCWLALGHIFHLFQPPGLDNPAPSQLCHPRVSTQYM